MKLVVLSLLMCCSLKSYSAERILHEGLERNDLYHELLKEGFVDELKSWFNVMVLKSHENPENLSQLHDDAQMIFSRAIRSCEHQEIGPRRKAISDMSSIFASISAQAGEMHNVIYHSEAYKEEWMKTMPTQKMNAALKRLLGVDEAEEFLFEE